MWAVTFVWLLVAVSAQRHLAECLFIASNTELVSFCLEG